MGWIVMGKRYSIIWEEWDEIKLIQSKFGGFFFFNFGCAFGGFVGGFSFSWGASGFIAFNCLCGFSFFHFFNF